MIASIRHDIKQQMEVQMDKDSRISVAIVGAGPYGLSVAAHLRQQGGDFRIFGLPMDAWRTRMPKGMVLKSEGFATNLSDPQGRFTLESYCKSNNLEYGDHVYPVPIDTFVQYGLAFQQELVPSLEKKHVTWVDHDGEDFVVSLDTGEIVRALNVVVASGLAKFANVPTELGGLPSSLASHSNEHADLGVFSGRDVTVIGAGQSGLETAALLSESGAKVRVLVRKGAVEWNRPPTNRSLLERMLNPRTPLGRGRRAWFYSNAAPLFHRLPAGRRLELVRRELGPAGAWWLRERVEGKIPILLNTQVRTAGSVAGRVRLQVEQGGETAEVETDHVIAATGYSVNIKRLSFVSPDLISGLKLIADTPILSPTFEASLPGLYFVGLASANSFGPLMRFAAGASPTARRLASHFRRNGMHH
jgi:cation diffusion facilitator CzcD-associated flavoprotein CzcO